MFKNITISRQFGSGGREIGKRLADRLEIAYYDKEIIGKIADETHLSASYIEKFSEASTSRQYPITFARTFTIPQMSLNDQIQIAQTNIIKELARKSECIFIGRCANYILNNNDTFKVFIYSSDLESRIKRCFARETSDKTHDQMAKEILKVDKTRAKYYNFYTGEKWSDISNYNLCIDTSKISIKEAVALIATCYENFLMR